MITRMFKLLWRKIFSTHAEQQEVRFTDKRFIEYQVRYNEAKQMFEAMEHCRAITSRRLSAFKDRGDLVELGDKKDIEMASNFVCALNADHTMLFMHSAPYEVQRGTDCALLAKLVKRYERYYTQMSISRERISKRYRRPIFKR